MRTAVTQRHQQSICYLIISSNLIRNYD